jgi:hypothetical protein
VAQVLVPHLPMRRPQSRQTLRRRQAPASLSSDAFALEPASRAPCRTLLYHYEIFNPDFRNAKDYVLL